MRLQQLICSEEPLNRCVGDCEELVCNSLYVFDPCQSNICLAASGSLGQYVDGVEMLFSSLLHYTKSIRVWILLTLPLLALVRPPLGI